MLLIHWGQRGGGPWFAARMAKALRDAWGEKVHTSLNQRAEILHQRNAEVENDLPVSTYSSVLQLVLGLPRLVWLGVRLRAYVKSQRIEVVYSSMLSIWQSVCTYFFLPRRTLFIASIHDATEHPGDAHWVLRACRWLDCTRADLIVVYSESARSILQGQKRPIRAPVVVVPLGADSPVDRPRCIEQRRRSSITLGFVGRIVEYKGLSLFVDLIHALRASGHDIRGVVIGSGSVDPALVESTADAIEWRIGWVPEKNLAAIFKEIDVLVLPYIEASQSGVFALALSAGVPSVVTPVGGLAAQVESASGGVVADEVSIDGLLRATLQVLEPSVYRQISISCLKAAAGSNSWKHSATILTNEIRSFIVSQGEQPDSTTGLSA